MKILIGLALVLSVGSLESAETTAGGTAFSAGAA
jgi:hypothetical protein